MKYCISISALTFGFVAAFSLSAQAETFGPWTPTTAPVSQYDGTYVSLGAGGFVQQTPNFNYIAFTNGNPFFSEAPDIVGGTGGVTLGILLDNRRMSWPGRKLRIEFSFGYGRGSGSDTQTLSVAALTGLDVFFGSVDGTRGQVLGCGNVCSTLTRLTVGYQSVSGAIRLKTDLRLARNLTLTPALGFVGGRSSVDYEIATVVSTVGSALVFPGSLNESLKTTRLGGEAAADLTWKINGKWTLHGGAGVALFRMGTRLKANDCMSTGGLPAGSACSGTLFQTSLSAFDHQTGYRVGMNAGATYDGGWFKLSLVGQALWDSDVPGVRNPSATLGPITAPARIVYSPQWRYGGFVSVTFPF